MGINLVTYEPVGHIEMTLTQLVSYFIAVFYINWLFELFTFDVAIPEICATSLPASQDENV
jgi:hypothetical protein